MGFADYFQTRCPACNNKLRVKLLKRPNTFGTKSVPAGQCHECNVDLQWVTSWQKGLVMAVIMAICVALTMLVVAKQFGSRTLPVEQLAGYVVGIFAVTAIFGGKKLAIKAGS